MKHTIRRLTQTIEYFQVKLQAAEQAQRDFKYMLDQAEKHIAELSTVSCRPDYAEALSEAQNNIAKLVFHEPTAEDEEYAKTNDILCVDVSNTLLWAHYDNGWRDDGKRLIGGFRVSRLTRKNIF